MMCTSKKKISLRALTSVYMVVSFIVMVISGLILYIAPPGRVANWTELTILVLRKDQWQSVHTIFTFLFILVGGLHIYYNWKPILTYFRTKMQSGFKLRKELLLSSVFAVVVFSLVLANVPLFKTVMDLGEKFSDSWSDDSSEPPVPHAEEMTLSEFANIVSTDVNAMIKKLQDNGILNVSENSVIKSLAEENNITPQQIYDKINADKQSVGEIQLQSGIGYGRKTIPELCEVLQITQESALANLSKYNLSIDLSKKVKDIASDNDILPIELVKMIQSEY